MFLWPEAISEGFCGCVEGTYYHEGICQPCIEGSACRGSSKIELLPGVSLGSRCGGDDWGP